MVAVNNKRVYVRADSTLQYSEFVAKMRDAEGGEDLKFHHLQYIDEMTDLSADFYDITDISQLAEDCNVEWTVM